MKNLKTIFACLLMAVLSIGQVWAVDQSFAFSTIGSTGWGGYADHTVTCADDGTVYMNASKQSGTITDIPVTKGQPVSFVLSDNTKSLSAVSFTCRQWTTKAQTITLKYSTNGGSSYNTLSPSVTSSNFSISSSSLPTGTNAVQITFSSQSNQVGIQSMSYTLAGSDPDPVLQSIAISGAPTTKNYENGNAFDPTGLVVTGTYDVGDPAAITSGITWTACKTESGTYVALDDEAVALAKDETGIYVKATVGEITSPAFHVTGLTVTAATPKITIDGSATGITTTDDAQTITAGVGSFGGIFKQYSTTALWFTKGSGYIYNTASFGYIRKITINYKSGGAGDAYQWIKMGSSAMDSYEAASTNGVKYETSAGGSSNTFVVDGDYEYFCLSVSNKNLQASSIVIEYDNNASAPKAATPTFPTGDENFVTSTSVTLACTTEGAKIYYTTNGDVPTSSSTLYNGAIPVSATTTIKAIAVADGMDNSNVAEKTFTKATVLTVAEAIALIPNKDDVVNNQYVAGVVCTAAPSLLSGGKLTYYISADGSETNRLQIYKGKNLNNTEFTAVSDLALGDRVTVFGQLKNFNNTPEMNDGNYLVSKAAPAVAAPTFSPDGGGFMGETDVTITCATAGNIIYYTLDGTTPSKSSNVYSEPIHLNATTTITAVAYVGDDASLVIAKTFTLTAPMTVADALTALDTEDPINNVAVAGIISTAPTANPSSGKLTYYISDDGTDTDELEVFLGFGLNGASFSAKTDLQVGDEVTVFGNLTIFNSTTKEFASGSRLLAFNRPEVAVTGIDLTESTAEVEVGKTVTLHASVVPANATNKTIVWSVQSGSDYASVENGVVTGIAAGEAVIRAASDENASIYEECTVTVTEPAPLSPWATVYTSNITLSVDENDTKAYAEKVKITVEEELTEFSALRAATGSAAGECHVIVPAGTQTLHFHAAAWNGKASTVTVKMGETTLLEQALTSDAGIANSSPYTLSGNAYEYYYSIDLSGYSLAEETRITFSVGSDKRFVLFGVNQVGGLVLESISVSGTATALEYNDGDHFSPAGLSVIGHYSDASTAPISEGIDWAFDPDPLTEGTTSVSVTATAGGFTSDPFVVDGLTVAGAAPLSPWATTYTSNITLSVDENDTKAYAEKVKITVEEELTEFSALRAATGSAAGECHVIVPAGTQTLHFHAAAWNGKASTVTVKMGETTLLEQALTSDAGIANSSPYTLSGNAYEYYYSIDLSGYSLAEETRITFSVGSDKRFVLFGVNQEGGVVPVLHHIAIDGTMTNTTGWKTGDDITPEGLTVNAYYTLNEVEQAPVDVTSSVVWSHDALVVDQTEVTLTATYTENAVVKSANTNVTIDAVEAGEPTIITNPTSYLNFGSSVEKDAVVAPKTITVTLKNITNATATLGGTNYSAFSIDDTEIVDGDVITVSVNTSTPDVYAGTVTIKDNDSETQKVINLSMTVVEPEIPEAAVSTSSKWIAAAAADLVDGKKVLITSVASEVTYAMGEDRGNNRAAVAGTLEASVFTPGANTMAFTLVDQGDGTFALRTSNGKYLYAAHSSSNYLKTRDEIEDGNAKWTLTATSAIANGDNTNETLRFNSGNNPKIFSCYADDTKQTAIALYVKQPTEIDNSTTEEAVETGDDVTVKEGGVLTINNAKQVGDVVVEAGGTVSASSYQLTVKDLTINTQSGKSGQLLGTNVNVTGNLYLDVQLCSGSLDADYWYIIAVPFDVNINDGISLADGTPMTNGVDYEVWIYDTQKRAQTTNGWKRANGKMEAGKAYFIGFNPGMPNTVRLKAAPGWKDHLFGGSSLALTKTAEEASAGVHDNWNGIANPKMRYVGIDKENVQMYSNESHTFSAYTGTDYDFVVGTAFFVKSTGSVTIADGSHLQFLAPKRDAERKLGYEVRITPAEAAEFDNQIIVRASESANGEYNSNRDMLTLNEATSKSAALLWTENYGDKRLAIEEAPLVNSSASYVLGIYAPADGEYTISTPQAKEDVSLYLTRNGRVIWDLTAAPYTLDLTKGNTTGYGLRIVAAPKATTGIEEVQSDKVQCTKVLINNHVFILRGEQLYDATGRLVK